MPPALLYYAEKAYTMSCPTGLDLRANVSYPCPDEHVLFTCSTPKRFLRWKIEFTDNHIEYTTIYDQYAIGSEYPMHHGMVDLLFTVVSTSTSAGTLSCTLSMSSAMAANNVVLNNTKVQCEDSVSDFIYYRIPGGMYFNSRYNY